MPKKLRLEVSFDSAQRKSFISTDYPQLKPNRLDSDSRDSGGYAAFFLTGELIKYGEGKTLFTVPKQKKTEDYIMGRFG